LTSAELITFDLLRHPVDYGELRRREYPPLEDLADAIYWMERKDKSLMEAWLKNCDAVKAKYPKTTPAR